MKIGITGASGFIGRHLVKQLNARSYDCVAFSRAARQAVTGCVETRAFRPDQPLDFSGLDVLVNLAGESIVGRWTDGKKWRVRESRIRSTERLVETLATMPRRPRLLVNASAIGIYGDRGDETLEERAAPGSGFLSDIAREWEAVALGAERCGVRTALIRIGLVLGADGGAFPPLRRAFGLGVGGRLGSGKQWMSPVHVADIAGIIVHLIEDEAAAGQQEARGVFNAVCPEPVRNVDFTQTLAQKLNRPAVLPMPAFVLRGLLGEMSHLLLDSARVVPTRLQQSGYTFQFPTLRGMLDDICRVPDHNKGS